MKLRHIAIAAIISAAACGATAQNIATPKVKADFKERQEKVANPAYFTVFDRNLTPQQREALEFLYAYMPLPDIADYSGDFFLTNVDATLRARKEMPWGKNIPDREWRHFVLPLRINNEALDNHRPEFYAELKDRVKGLSMKDAILEVNHWCHEKATYEPSDSRTHSPLATVSSAIGRCGEESTFTVGALRAVGIPARQIYTPRWAHTDDNHAWVEAWADGQWYFLGACEPEPVLNLGWFNAPASRGMMMNTYAFGAYDGPEEVLATPDGYTNINVTTNYAPVNTITVNVTDRQGRPAAGTEVSFRLYNYGEFYPIATKTTDQHGRASLSAGIGDVVVWATDGKNFGMTKGSVGRDRNVAVTLDLTPSYTGVKEMDIIPPVASNKPVEVTPAQAAENDRRKVYEDSLRGAYTATFFTRERGEDLGRRLGLDPARVAAVMIDARGNHKTIEQFLSGVPEADRERALTLVESLSVKDRSDVPAVILADHLTAPVYDTPLYAEYILSPRIDNEALTPFRSYFSATVGKDEAARMRANPAELVAQTARDITILPDWYPGNIRMSPEAVDRSKATNAASRDIYFVAKARSLGIPARIDPVTGKTQWADAKGNWTDASFGGDSSASAKPASQGTLKLAFTKTGRIDDPKYYTQFTLSKIADGRPQLLGFPEDATWSSILRDGQKLDEGQYMLVSGQRMADGGVLSRAQFFDIRSESTVSDTLVMRQDNKGVQVIGNFNSENTYTDLASGAEKSVLSTTGRGYYVIGLLTPNHEPTNHALRDIAAVAPEFEKWGRGMILLFKDRQDAGRFDSSLLPELPSTVSYGIDTDGKIAAEIIGNLKLSTTERPVFIIADTFNRIVFVSQGYTIGLGDQIVDTIHHLGE